MVSTSANRDILMMNRDGRILKATRKTLSRAGYSVHTCMSKREALFKLANEPIGLMICDAVLQDVTTLQFLTVLKNDPLKKSTPFIFYVSLENQKYLKPFQAVQWHALDYMVYPMDENDFLSRIAEIIPPPNIGTDVSKQRENERPSASGDKRPTVAAPGAETSKESLFDFLSPVSILISPDNENWSQSQLVNFDHAQGLMAAPFPSRVGETIKIKCWLPDGEAICSGQVVHVISGDKERQAGYLVDFQKDPEWSRLYGWLKPDDSASPDAREPAVNPDSAPNAIPAPSPDAETPTPVFNPSANDSARDPTPKKTENVSPAAGKIRVSRDGSYWTPGQITDYGASHAVLNTSILAKTGDAMQIQYPSSKNPIVVTGKVEKISLNDLYGTAASIQIAFPEKSEWRRVCGYLGSASHPVPLKNVAGLSAKSPLKPSLFQTSSEPGTAEEQTEKTMFDTLIQKERSIKSQFYRSLIGKQLDNYVINSFISSGGMGGVFKGWDMALERDVALKVIAYDLSSQKKFVDMFFKEARFASKLNHPNIAQIYYIGKANDILYFVMEFVHGQTLRELATKKGSLSLRRKIKFFLTVCAALDFVWQKRIIHRDIKPENIMVNNNGVAKIVDFGVAKQFRNGKSSRRQKIIGSPRYLSPEVILGNPVDQRSDIYSLGATFYYFLTNNPPFSGNSVDVVLYKHINDKVVPLYKINPAIPVPLSDIIEKMLAKNPDDRYQDYKTIIRDVEQHAHLWKN